MPYLVQGLLLCFGFRLWQRKSSNNKNMLTLKMENSKKKEWIYGNQLKYGYQVYVRK